MTTIEERLDKLETDSTANAVVQRQLTESIEALTVKVDEGFASLDNRLGKVETRLGGVESAVRELTTEIRNGRNIQVQQSVEGRQSGRRR